MAYTGRNDGVVHEAAMHEAAMHEATDLPVPDQSRCRRCGGLGMSLEPKRARHLFPYCICRCRVAFRAALQLWRIALMGPMGHGQPDYTRIDYAADFERLAKTWCLQQGGVYPTILDLYFFRRMPWPLVATRTGLTRSATQHAIGRIERQVGTLLLTLRPYPLYPLVWYLAASHKPDPPIRNKAGVWRPAIPLYAGRCSTNNRELEIV